MPDRNIDVNSASPIIGYRVWHWDCFGLCSFNGDAWLPNQRFQAQCNRSVYRHEAPRHDCACGIYAAKSLDQLRRMGYDDLGIYGEVSLWGRVLEHEFGWRAQYAYPRTFVLMPENLLLGRFVQRELSTKEMACLEDLTRYGADIYLSEENSLLLCRKGFSGFKHLLETVTRNVVTVPVAVLMEDYRQERLVQNGIEIDHSSEIIFDDVQFPVSRSHPLIQQIRNMRARVVVIDLDHTLRRTAFYVIGLIHQISNHIALFVRSEASGLNLNISVSRAVQAAYARDAHVDSWLRKGDRNDVLSAYDAFRRVKRTLQNLPSREIAPGTLFRL